MRPPGILVSRSILMPMSVAPSSHDRVLPAEEGIHSERQYANAVNPHWVRLLKLLQMNVHYERCQGAELFTTKGRRILDFLSGYCVHNLGHNHLAIIAALKDELDRHGPAMLQSHVPERAGELAERLCSLVGGRMSKAFFCSSGSEGIEAAIKFARAHIKRTGLLYAERAFNGLTCGALSLMGDPFWKQGFGPLLSGTQQIPFNNLSALEQQLRTQSYAAFFVEPIQGEGGIRLPTPDYLSQASALCKRYGTLLVLDEVQTGFFRTGPFLAAHHDSVQPDMVVLAKAMSGGLVEVTGRAWHQSNRREERRMADMSRDYASAVNKVIAVCRDAEEGFRGATQATRDVSLRTLFEQYSSQRAQFAEQLRAVVKETGNEPAGVAGTLHRAGLF